MNTQLFHSKKVLRTVLFLMIIGIGMGKSFAQNNPGLPGGHGLEGNQDANGGSPAMTTQTLAMDEGWNWVSLYLECDANLLTALQAGIAQNNVTGVIKDMNTSDILQNGSWSGNLSLTNESMVMVYLKNPTTVTLSASLANPANHTITLEPGWNWICYPLDHSISVSEALSGITPHNNDLIKNMSGSASFTNNTWQGSLKSLVPGEGYMYYNNGSAMTLTYPTSK